MPWAGFIKPIYKYENILNYRSNCVSICINPRWIYVRDTGLQCLAAGNVRES